MNIIKHIKFFIILSIMMPSWLQAMAKGKGEDQTTINRTIASWYQRQSQETTWQNLTTDLLETYYLGYSLYSLQELQNAIQNALRNRSNSKVTQEKLTNINHILRLIMIYNEHEKNIANFYEELTDFLDSLATINLQTKQEYLVFLNNEYNHNRNLVDQVQIASVLLPLTQEARTTYFNLQRQVDNVTEHTWQAIASQIIRSLNESFRTARSITKEQYITIFQSLQRAEAAKVYARHSFKMNTITEVLKQLCASTLPNQELKTEYNNLINYIEDQDADLQTINNRITLLSFPDISIANQILLFQALQKYYAHDEAINHAIEEKLRTVQDPRQREPIVVDIAPEIITDHEILVNQLTQASYFSPALQYDALKSVGRPFIINITTGVPENLPTAHEIIQSQEEPALQLKGLQAVLEATYIAWTTAQLDVAYANPGYRLWAPGIEADLNTAFKKQIQDINTALRLIQPNIFSQAAFATYNLFFSTGQGFTRENMQPQRLNEHLYELPEALITKIIKNNNFTQELNYDEAANLIFKQCFILQQARLENNGLYIAVQMQGPISQTNYIFNRLPNINQLCNEIQRRVNQAQATNENLREIQQYAHELLLTIRESLQIALYIANKNSTFNQIINYFTSFLTIYNYNPLQPQINYLDKVVQQLLTYDSKLAQLCKNPQLGATSLDAQRQDTIINALTTIVSGAVVTGITLSSIYATYKGSQALYNIVNNGSTSSANSPIATSSTTYSKDQAVQTSPNLLQFLPGFSASSTPQPMPPQNKPQNQGLEKATQGLLDNLAQKTQGLVTSVKDDIFSSFSPETQNKLLKAQEIYEENIAPIVEPIAPYLVGGTAIKGLQKGATMIKTAKTVKNIPPGVNATKTIPNPIPTPQAPTPTPLPASTKPTIPTTQTSKNSAPPLQAAQALQPTTPKEASFGSKISSFLKDTTVTTGVTTAAIGSAALAQSLQSDTKATQQIAKPLSSSPVEKASATNNTTLSTTNGTPATESLQSAQNGEVIAPIQPVQIIEQYPQQKSKEHSTLEKVAGMISDKPRTINNWQGNVDAENYGLPGFSDQEAVGTIAAIGGGTAIRNSIVTALDAGKNAAGAPPKTGFNMYQPQGVIKTNSSTTTAPQILSSTQNGYSIYKSQGAIPAATVS